MEYTFVVGSQQYEISTYCVRHNAFASANVKLRDYGRLPVKYQRKLDRLYKLGHTDEVRFNNWVWEDFQRSWWERFQEDATEAGLGKVSSGGRSGGWLLLDAYSQECVSDLHRVATVICDKCNQIFSSHVGPNHQCLFASTFFTFEDYDDIDFKEITRAANTLVNVATFLKKCEDNVKQYATADFVYTQKFIIDNLWEQYRETATAHRVLQAKTG